MALEHRKTSEIPPDAQILTEHQAAQYQMKIMMGWDKPSDVFAFKYGPYVLGAATFFTGVYMNNYFRLRFMAGGFGRAASYIPSCVLPAAITPVFHSLFVTKDVLLQKSCPVCLEVRASTIQTGLGVVSPMVLAALAALQVAHLHATYDVPYLTSQPKKVLKLLVQKVRPMSNLLVAITIGHALLASAVTYLEARSVEKVTTKVQKIMEDVEKRNAITDNDA